MFIHTVLFHLKDSLSKDQIKAFEAGLDSLRNIKANSACYVGTVADTKDRPIVRSDYSYNLTLLFEDIEAHNAYQVDPLHKAFVAEFSPLWERLEIIDSD